MELMMNYMEKTMTDENIEPFVLSIKKNSHTCKSPSIALITVMPNYDDSEETRIYAVKICGRILKGITNQTSEIIQAALEQDPSSYEFIDREKFPDLYEYGKLLAT